MTSSRPTGPSAYLSPLPPQTNLKPLLRAWLLAGPLAPKMNVVERLCERSRPFWKEGGLVGTFSGWVDVTKGLPVRVEGTWGSQGILKPYCSLCGPKVCVHVAAIALGLPPLPSNQINSINERPVVEEPYPCRIAFHLGSWKVRNLDRQRYRIDGGELQFHYGPRSVVETLPGSRVEWKTQIDNRYCLRDAVAEQEAKDLLESLKWRRVAHSSLRSPHPNDDKNWIDFIANHVPQLRTLGWEVDIPDSMGFQIFEPKTWTGAWTPREKGAFELELKIEFDGGTIGIVDLFERLLSLDDPAALQARLQQGHDLTVRLDKGWLKIPAKRAEQILSAMRMIHQDGRPPTTSTLMASRLGDLGIADAKWTLPTDISSLRTRLESLQAPVEASVPETVHASLRGYQVQGLSWLQWLSHNEFGGILADDMGLGKTLQTIAHLACEVQEGRLTKPALVVCPTSLVSNWVSELGRFAPDLRVVVLHGADRHDRRDEADQAQVVVTTYPLLTRDEPWLTSRSWHLLVLDEAQVLKNPTSVARKVASELQATHRLALTGTPMENHLEELWSLVDLVQPGLLGTRTHFRTRVATRIERQGDRGLLERLRSVIAPFLLRRTKAEVASELPEKLEIVQKIELYGSQRDLYEIVRTSQNLRLQQLIHEIGWQASGIQVLEALLRLRQTCCDTRLLPPELSQGTEHSAKLEWLAETIPEMVDEGRRILIFSQFTKFLDLVEPILSEAKIPYVRLDGSTQDRAGVVESFQSESVPVFLLSLKAGGTGLNLTAADTVVFLDPWWNPAVEAQAMDRAHRIGQTKPVFVYRLVAQGTIEERILALQAHKADLAASLLEGGGAASVKFTPEDLAELLRPLG